jgi:23S rRNA (guanosine2251-2'-O)-methyltransferase
MDVADTFESFALCQKNRNACIHWLLQLAQRIERDWADEPLRRARLEVLRTCLEACRAHAHEDVRELGALAPRMLRHLDFDERHFLNLMLPIERKHSKGLRDHEFLVTTEDRPEAGGASERLPLVLVLDHLRSAFNVGAIFRTADCLGVQKILACGYTATPDDATVQKTSLGACAHVPWEWRRDAGAAIDELRARGVPVIALETVPSAPSADAYSFPRTGCALRLRHRQRRRQAEWPCRVWPWPWVERLEASRHAAVWHAAQRAARCRVGTPRLTPSLCACRVHLADARCCWVTSGTASRTSCLRDAMVWCACPRVA